MVDKWINIGQLSNFQSGKKQLIIYANTIDMVWYVGVIDG